MSASVRKEQDAIAGFYADQFGIESDDVLFLSTRDPYEPWFNKDALLSICRQSPDVREAGERFDQHCASLNEVIHVARVVRSDGKAFELSGAAVIGERIPRSDDGEEADAHKLAAARALRTAMDAAGLNPLRPGGLVQSVVVSDDPRRRTNDLARIHILAKEVGLIEGREKKRYREWLKDHFRVSTAVRLDQKGRASAIALLADMAGKVKRAKRR